MKLLVTAINLDFETDNDFYKVKFDEQIEIENLNRKSRLQIRIAKLSCTSKVQIETANLNCKSKAQI